MSSNPESSHIEDIEESAAEEIEEREAAPAPPRTETMIYAEPNLKVDTIDPDAVESLYQWEELDMSQRLNEQLNEEVARLKEKVAQQEKEIEHLKNLDGQSRGTLRKHIDTNYVEAQTRSVEAKTRSVDSKTQNSLLQMLGEKLRPLSMATSDQETKEESENNDLFTLEESRGKEPEAEPTVISPPAPLVKNNNPRHSKDTNKAYVCDYKLDGTKVSSYEYNLEEVFKGMENRCTKIELKDTYVRTDTQLTNFGVFAHTVSPRAYAKKGEECAVKVVKTLKLITNPIEVDQYQYPNVKYDIRKNIQNTFYKVKETNSFVLELKAEEDRKDRFDELSRKISKANETRELSLKSASRSANWRQQTKKTEKTYNDHVDEAEKGFLAEIDSRERTFEKLKEELYEQHGVLFEWEIDASLHDREAVFYEGNDRKFLVTLGRGLDYFEVFYGPYARCKNTRIIVLKFL